MAMAAGGFHARWPPPPGRAASSARWGWKARCASATARNSRRCPKARREARFRELLARQVAEGRALNMAATLEIDTVIDPADTRAWLLRQLDSAVAREAQRRGLDPW